MRIAIPTATPAMMREMTKMVKFVVNADSSAEPAKSSAVTISTFFRPNRSLKKPATALPPNAPQPRQLTAQPNFKSPLVPVRSKYFLMNGTAPEMTVASKPSRKPPIATVSATATMYLLF